MITIDFNTFWSEQNLLKETCIDFIHNILGPSDRVTIKKDDESDSESSFSVYFNYSKYQLKGFGFFDELMDFAIHNELYVIVYDHDTKSRKGYWYDEDDEWVELENVEMANYKK